jgi:hypothetical protein
VRARRNLLHIPAKYAPRWPLWTPKEEALLGVLPDRDFAKRFNRTLVAVQDRRRGKGIPPADPKVRRFTPEEDALLGTIPDKEAALRLNRPTAVVRQRRLRLRLRQIENGQ